MRGDLASLPGPPLKIYLPPLELPWKTTCGAGGFHIRQCPASVLTATPSQDTIMARPCHRLGGPEWTLGWGFVCTERGAGELSLQVSQLGRDAAGSHLLRPRGQASHPVQQPAQLPCCSGWDVGAAPSSLLPSPLHQHLPLPSRGHVDSSQTWLHHTRLALLTRSPGARGPLLTLLFLEELG